MPNEVVSVSAGDMFVTSLKKCVMVRFGARCNSIPSCTCKALNTAAALLRGLAENKVSGSVNQVEVDHSVFKRTKSKLFQV